MSDAASSTVRALPSSPPSGFDRVPPHDLDAETSVVGAMLLSKDAIAEVSEIVGPEDFYRGAHRTMFEAIHELYDRGEPVDAVTLADELKRRGRLDDVGGAVGIADLLSKVPTAANALYYAKIVAAHALRRRLIDAGTRITRLGYTDEEDVHTSVDSAESLVYQLSQYGRVSEFTPMKRLIAQGFELIERLHENNSAITGLATGFTDLDELTAGLQPSNLVILAARPSHGKCLSGSTEVVDGVTGEVTPIAELVRRGRRGEPVGVVTLGQDFSFGNRGDATAFHDNGVQPVFRVRTRLGHEVVATANHPLLTPDGWLPLAMLRRGWRIAAARTLPYFGHERMPEHEVRLLAYLVATEPATRFVPKAVFRLPREQLASFLNRLFACDGCVHLDEQDARVAYPTSSERLARQVQHLLRRFGVIARLRELERPVYERTGTRAWELQITAADSVRRFALEIGILGREAQLEAVLRLFDPTGGRPRRELREATPRPPGHSRHAGERAAGALLTETAEHDEEPVLAGPASDVYWDEIDSVEPAGEERVYDLTVPATHNFVANDLVVHNSTLAVNMATNVAVEQRRPVVLFSLEMSQMELVQRILAAEARVDSERLRTGRLREADWPKLSQAMGRLAEAPLFIDDTPGITLMEIRSKARRLKQQHGLDLLIVDYLQLMQSHRRVESRVQEVAELSRGLKILAKELDIPVLALSQLSRRPEDRTDRRPQLADLRESGCLTADTRVLRADTGAEVTMGQLHASGERDIPVWTVDHDYRMVPGTMSHVFCTGRKAVFRLQLASGRAVDASANHPFLTYRGWTRLDELEVGGRLAVPRCVPEPATTVVRADEGVARLARLVGEAHDGLPAEVFGLKDPQLALFLRHLWAAGGHLDLAGGHVRLRYAGSSRRAVEDLQLVLLRFGVHSRICGPVRYRGTYELSIGDADAQLRFLTHVGVHGSRAEAANELAARLRRGQPRSAADTVPAAAWEQVHERRRALGLSVDELHARAGLPGPAGDPSPDRLSRGRLAALAAALADDGLAALAASDLHWDTVVAVTPLGEQPVYDATVPGTHNFVAGNIVVENSIEQDADIVCFIYRDEVYNPESTAKGEAELIVAKHRNGPLKTLHLAFLGATSRFASLRRSPPAGSPGGGQPGPGGPPPPGAPL